MLTMRSGGAIGTAICALLVTMAAALGDVIDGQWCAKDGRRMRIDGEHVTTPGGMKIKGEYDRHHYLFRVPAFEPNAGKDADLVLVSNTVIHLRYHTGSDERSDTPPEVWTRCKEPVSSLPPGRHLVRFGLTAH